MAKKAPAKPVASDVINVQQFEQQTVRVRIEGVSGLVCNRMGSKAKQALLIGSGGPKKASTKKEVKHKPFDEFRDSMHLCPDAHDHTSVFMPAVAVKSAMATSAIELEGVTAAAIKRLVYFPDEYVPIYGLPFLRMDVVRLAGPSRVADIRTRAFFPRWWSEFDVVYTPARITRESIFALLQNAGLIIGIGDYRQEKGKGSFGLFQVTTEELPSGAVDKQYQKARIDKPVLYDAETEQLMEFYQSAVADAA